ncbi:MAG: SpoIIE family protein phosphatase [Pseudomonadota bacterium]
MAMSSAAAHPNTSMLSAETSEFRKLVALIVDDSASQRTTLRILLRKWNFETIEAKSGEEALDICRTSDIDFVISDWMMPGMTGPELCRALRQLNLERYIYLILLTSKSDKDDITEGFEAGADDFLAKPMEPSELKARLQTGRRIISMQEDMVEKNRRISEAFDRLNLLYKRIDDDLRSASRMQQSLIPPRQTRCGPVNIGVLYQPSGHVGGDLVGFFEIAVNRIALYAIDVAGHGVSSALMTARLSNFFSGQHLDENIGIRRLPSGEYSSRNPANIAAELNERLQDDADTDLYFTMLYADVNLDTGTVVLCQAGHPNPALIRRSGQIEFPGEGGLPIGLVPDIAYDTVTITMKPGDRLIMFSDGITECENGDGAMLDEDGLAEIVKGKPDLGEAALLDEIIKGMTAFAGTDHFSDDVSALAFTMP